MNELERIGQSLSDAMFQDVRYQYSFPNAMVTDYLRLKGLDDKKSPVAKSICLGRRCEFDFTARCLLRQELEQIERDGWT